MHHKIQRSMLILPVNVPKFVEKAHTRGADAITLDLEDAVPPAEKENARALVRDSIRLAGLGGADVLVRVNNDEEHIYKDLDAAIHEGLAAVFLPKTELPEQVLKLEALIEKMERDRGLKSHSIKIAIHIESPLGIINLKEIAGAGSRLESVSMGVDDYCLQMGIRPSDSAEELVFPMMNLVIVARALNLIPLGVWGSVADFKDMDKFRIAAEKSKKMGFAGAYCIHPDQVNILNEVFSPSMEELSWARSVMECFEKAVAEGRASTSLDGKMVDTPIYKQALALIEEAQSIGILEKRKRETLSQNKGA